jgi:hypothetical protein
MRTHHATDFQNPFDTADMGARFAKRGLSLHLLDVTLIAHHANDDAHKAAIHGYEAMLETIDKRIVA